MSPVQSVSEPHNKLGSLNRLKDPITDWRNLWPPVSIDFAQTDCPRSHWLLGLIVNELLSSNINLYIWFENTIQFRNKFLTCHLQYAISHDTRHEASLVLCSELMCTAKRAIISVCYGTPVSTSSSHIHDQLLLSDLITWQRTTKTDSGAAVDD